MPIRSFANQTTADVFAGANSKFSRQIPQRVWGAAQRKLSVVHAASSTKDFVLPGLRFEPLKYDRPGFYSVRVNDQYRIIFRFENGDAYDVAIEDFHGRRFT